MAIFLAFLSFIFSTHGGRDSGEYFSHYNQSEFEWSGSPKGYCTLKANYQSGGKKDRWLGCENTVLSYESQQEFDLTYWELLKVCPTLLKTPPEERGTVDYSKPKKGKGKYLLPDQLVWSDECSTSDYDTNPFGSLSDPNGPYYCPRWQCDNSSELWSDGYNRSYTWHEVTRLEWSSKPLTSTCWVCHCAYWDSNGGDDWVWTCDTSGNAWRAGASGWGGRGWPETDLNPIDNPLLYPTRSCKDPTNAPTPDPTGDTPGPTPGPTPPPTTALCSSQWDGLLLNWDINAGEYFWDTPAQDDCSEIKFCKCMDDGSSYCKSSYAEIMDDAALYPGYIERCGKGSNDNYLAECWTPDKAGQLFQWYDFTGATPHPSCSFELDVFCPRCGCTTEPFTQTPRTNSTSNTTVYSGTSFDSVTNATIYTYSCTECKCKYEDTNTSRGWASYMDCSGISPYDTINNNEQYPNDLSVDCFYANRKCISHSGEYDPAAGTTPCNNQRRNDTEFESYCNFERITYEDSTDENVCVEQYLERIGEWGCGGQYCDLFGGDGCYYADYDYKVAQYDCINDKWIGDTLKADHTYSCCSDGWNCNNRTIDSYLEDETCTRSTEMENIYGYRYSCWLSQRNLYELTDDETLIRAAFCGDSLDYDAYESDAEQDSKETYCTLLKVYWQYYTFCECNTKRLYIAALNEVEPQLKDTKYMIKYVKDDFWSGIDDEGKDFGTLRTRLSIMYDFWSCIDYEDDATETNANTFFTCDFDAEVEKISNKGVDDAANNVFTYWHYIIVLIAFLFNTPSDNRFISVFVISILGIMYVNGATDYDWSMWYYNGNHDMCKFGGSVSTGNSQVCEQITYEKSVFQNEDLTWDILIEACPYLEYGGCYTKDKQLDMNKLIWPNADNKCNDCPKCPCSNATDTNRHFITDNYNLNIFKPMISKTCFECLCLWDGHAEDYAWNCTEGVTQEEPNALNNTEFCPDTIAPTSAPTEALTIECVSGNTFDTLSTTKTTIYGEYGSSHCGWKNITRERYPDAEPAVCVSDQIAPQNEWFASPNNKGPCIALAGANTGCYYTEYDQTVEQYDCARKKWISDKYRIAATIYCCNNGYYCNNQTMVQGGGSINEVEYYNYENMTETVKCKKSEKLKQYLQNQWCEYTNPGGDSDYYYKRQCKDSVTDKRPTCGDLEKYWARYSRCRCKRSKWFRNNVNSTYQEYIDEDFETWATPTASKLIEWSETLNCGWEYGTKWYCSGTNNHFISIIAVIFIAVVSIFS